MARKKRVEEHENHERWLVSYADFITLLFAFFVVMYALSSINEGKYRVLSDSLVSAFQTPPKSMTPIQVGEPVKSETKAIADIRPELNKQPAADPIAKPEPIQHEAGQGGEREYEPLNRMQKKLEKSLANMIERELIAVKRTGRGLEVEINTAILFDSGKALLQAQAIKPLSEIAAAIKAFPNAIQVEGFTDNIPIESAAFPSNWELSASRAASVVHLFSDVGVDPFKMAAIGYGEHRPLASNKTAEGRSRNRRVVVVIMAEEAKNLYNPDEAVQLVPEDKRVKNIDLDTPVPLVEEPVSLAPGGPLPDINLPKDLPLRGRAAPAGSEGQLHTIIETIDAEKGTTP